MPLLFSLGEQQPWGEGPDFVFLNFELPPTSDERQPARMERCKVIGLTKTRNLGVVKERSSTPAKVQDAQDRILTGDLQTFFFFLVHFIC